VTADAPARHDIRTFQGMIATLQDYWSSQGCIVQQPYDMEVGAGTFHTSTFLRAIGPEPWHACHTQASRRPTDGRYGENPNRLQHYYQFQVVMKPSPADMQALYLGSLEALGFDPLEITYGDVFHQNEVEQSAYNFEHANVDELFHQFDACETACQALLELETPLPLPAYEHVLSASHAFNLLDARHAISVTERQRYILRVRTLARGVAEAYAASRERLGHPLLRHTKAEVPA